MKTPEEIQAEEVARLLDPRRLTLFIAGIATLVASNLCVNLIGRHTRDWTKPREQRAIMAIVGLAPIVALDSYFGLAEMPGFEWQVALLHVLRDSYVAFGVSEFLALLFAYLQVPHQPTAPLPHAASRRMLHHSFPFTLFLRPEVRANRATLNRLSQWIRQLVRLLPVLSLLSCLLHLQASLLLSPPVHSALSWLLTLSQHASLYLAAYALLLLYYTFEDQFAPFHALSKFLCLVPLVFLPYWQSVVVDLLVGYGRIQPHQLPYTPRNVEQAVNHFLICCEMLPAAVALCYAFPESEYSLERRQRENQEDGVNAD
ncbi:hypothetical protein CLOM_g21767 [Closterium sp. NIES-68]|nr:hypothetical protein CLOM_g21767 [Closterium sp. NIES-68]GJP79856.1 hypothetical protein CLOP_g10058 [Closterium sp. NIES-67]